MGNDYRVWPETPGVTRAAADAALRRGAGSTGSRLAGGTTALHTEFETELAGLRGAEDSRCARQAPRPLATGRVPMAPLGSELAHEQGRPVA